MYGAARSLARLDEYGACLGMRLDRVLDLFGTHRASPFALDLVTGGAVCGEQPPPALAEFAAVDENRMLARRDEVGHRSFHRTGTARSDQDDLLLRAEQRLQPLARAIQHGAEFGRPMMDGRARHFEQHLRR